MGRNNTPPTGTHDKTESPSLPVRLRSAGMRALGAECYPMLAEHCKRIATNLVITKPVCDAEDNKRGGAAVTILHEKRSTPITYCSRSCRPTLTRPRWEQTNTQTAELTGKVSSPTAADGHLQPPSRPDACCVTTPPALKPESHQDTVSKDVCDERVCAQRRSMGGCVQARGANEVSSDFLRALPPAFMLRPGSERDGCNVSP